jgi:3-oxoacyl-[acyl-carrier-protein] synthase II
MSSNGQPAIVITGIGVVSPFGVGRDPFWQHVSRGCSGTKAITQFDVSVSEPRGGVGAAGVDG